MSIRTRSHWTPILSLATVLGLDIGCRCSEPTESIRNDGATKDAEVVCSRWGAKRTIAEFTGRFSAIGEDGQRMHADGSFNEMTADETHIFLHLADSEPPGRPVGTIVSVSRVDGVQTNLVDEFVLPAALNSLQVDGEYLLWGENGNRYNVGGVGRMPKRGGQIEYLTRNAADAVAADASYVWWTGTEGGDSACLWRLAKSSPASSKPAKVRCNVGPKFFVDRNTNELIWTQEGQTFTAIWVAGPNGESPRELGRGPLATGMATTANSVLWVGGPEGNTSVYRIPRTGGGLETLAVSDAGWRGAPWGLAANDSYTIWGERGSVLCVSATNPDPVVITEAVLFSSSSTILLLNDKLLMATALKSKIAIVELSTQ
jgi:hypothetical protein